MLPDTPTPPGPIGVPGHDAADGAQLAQRLEAMGRQLVGRESPAPPASLLAAVQRRRTARWALPLGLSALAAAAVWVIAASLGPVPTRATGTVPPLPVPVAGAHAEPTASTAPTLANLWQLNAGRADAEPVLPEAPRGRPDAGPIPTARDAYRAGAVPLP